MRDLISVVIPVYKTEKYLCRCVDSVLRQTYAEIEIILVDDGSPDNAGAICDDYQKKYDNVHVIHQSNQGLAAARNVGIDFVKKERLSRWIAFIDSDDYVHPNMFEYLHRAVVEYNVKISACGVDEVKEFVVQNVAYKKPGLINGLEYFVYCLDKLPTIAVNKLYDVELFNEIRYPYGRTHEDQYTTYKLLYKSGMIAILDINLYYYFQSENSITRSCYTLNRLNDIIALEEQWRFFKKLGNKDYLLERTIVLFDEYSKHAKELRKAGYYDECERINRKLVRLIDYMKKKYPLYIINNFGYFRNSFSKSNLLKSLSELFINSIYKEGLIKTINSIIKKIIKHYCRKDTCS
ncbi:MAG: glycosyltransferase [Lachnospiraceae bacterium]|nr:glycosyltransferase [Lachnospiraceae bacterium]